MDSIRQYLLTVLCGAFICAIVIRLAGNYRLCAKIIKLVASIFLSLAVVSPVLKLDLQKITEQFTITEESGTSIVSDSQITALEETAAIIIERTETYIKDKATMYGANLNVSVCISDITTLLPDEVVIQGNISPYGKSVLTSIIEEDLGIPKGKQIWK